MKPFVIIEQTPDEEISVYCFKDVTQARKHFLKLIEEYEKKGVLFIKQYIDDGMVCSLNDTRIEIVESKTEVLV